MHRFALAIALAAAAGLAHGQAKSFAYEAELAQPAPRASANAGGVTWSCTGARCTARGRGGNVSVKGCAELARAVGPVVAYRSEIKSLAGASLRECNRRALGGGAASVKAPARPQRTTTPEIAFTGVAPAGDTAERRP